VAVEIRFFLEQIIQSDLRQNVIDCSLNSTPHGPDRAIDGMRAGPLKTGKLIAKPRLKEAAAKEREDFGNRYGARAARQPARFRE
jgi:hypothetical protein